MNAALTIISAIEIWLHPAGGRFELFRIPIDLGPQGDGDTGWFPEAPGQLPPENWVVRSVATGAVRTRTVFPLAPWTGYDAMTDQMLAAGWRPEADADSGLCEHGLAAELCAGPQHFPFDADEIAAGHRNA